MKNALFVVVVVINVVVVQRLLLSRLHCGVLFTTKEFQISLWNSLGDNSVKAGIGFTQFSNDITANVFNNAQTVLFFAYIELTSF